MRFAGWFFWFIWGFSFTVLFSCRIVEARFLLRFLVLKFGVFWGASCLLTLWLSLAFGFIPEAVTMPAVLAVIPITTPLPILVHVVKR